VAASMCATYIDACIVPLEDRPHQPSTRAYEDGTDAAPSQTQHCAACPFSPPNISGRIANERLLQCACAGKRLEKGWCKGEGGSDKGNGPTRKGPNGEIKRKR
jgi:hypothetical protein